ncbi:MAG: phage portal protein [Clostridia bacterium]|nr:phage portal protein [Clostridia bacterium]
MDLKQIFKRKKSDLNEKKSDEFSFDFTRFLEKEIDKFKVSRKRKNMLNGERYYDGKHDILKRKRTIIGQGGELIEVDNLPNNLIIDNQYARMVDQKNNYLLSKALTFDSEDKVFLKCVKNIFDNRFLKTLKGIGQDCFNCGIAYLYTYYDDFGKLNFKRLVPFEIIPFWKNEEHSILEFAIRIYEIEAYEKGQAINIEKVEVYLKEGIKRFILKGQKLIPENNGKIIPYINDGENDFNFGKVPIVAFRQNDRELPLILKIKALQDALNTVHSDFMNNLQEDARNTILVLKNYDGTNLGEFRKNLAQFGVVKVKSVEGADGGVSTLKIDINSDNFKTVSNLLKTAIVENARGIDSKSEKMFGDLSKMNIQSIYSDIDLDANSMENEFKASFEDLLFFVKFYLKNQGFGNFDFSNLEIIFNRDILINETESIDNCIKSLQILSKDTVISQHPWVHNIEKENYKIKKEGIFYGQKTTITNGPIRRTSRTNISRKSTRN